MPEIISCPQCRRRLSLPVECQGQTVQCPSCQTTFVADATQPPAPVALPVDTAAVREGNPYEGAGVDEPAPAGARGERRRRPFPTNPRKKSGLQVGLGTIGAVAVVVVVIYLAVRSSLQRQPLAFNEDNDERRREVLEAFQKQKPLDPDQIAGELKPLFDGLGQALKARDGQSCVNWFDTSRMLDELVALEVIPAHVARRRGETLRQLSLALSQALIQQAPLMEWNGFEIRRVKKLEGNEAMVIIRHSTKDGMFIKMRWWVTKRPGSWRIFDFEDLDGGMRFSTLAAEVGRDARQQAVPGMANLRQAMLAAINNDPDTAERELKQIGLQKLPKKIDALRLMIQALVHLQRQKAQDALDTIEQAQRLNPDMPILDRLKGTAYNLLGKWQDALKHLTTYKDLLGDDFLVCFELGESLRGLGRFPEARDQYRKALNYDPKGADAFLGLVRTLEPEDKREELAERFAKLDNHHQNFDIAADDCVQARDGPALEQLVVAMRKIDRGYQKLDYYQAMALAWVGKADRALPLFKKALERQNDPGKRKDWLNNFLLDMVDAGKALEAYQTLPEPGETFRILADDMRHRPELRTLLALHAKKHAGDPLLPLYHAGLNVQDGKFALANEAFEKAFGKKPDPDLLLRFRHDWVLARYRLGKGMQAYADIQPRHEVFLDLASMCMGDRNYALLETLVEAHAKNEPDSLEVVQYRIRLKIKQDKFADGVALFKAALAKEDNVNRRQQLESSFLFDMSDAGKAVEAYQAVPESRMVLEIIGSDLLNRAGGQQLKKILELHRQRHADDPLIAFYQGELHMASQAWDEAARDYAQAWATAGKEQNKGNSFPLRDRFRTNYICALYKSGRHLEAYQKIEPRPETFRQLVNLMVSDKKPAELEELLASHRPNAKDDPEFLLAEARAKILSKKISDGIALFQKAYQKQTNHLLRRSFQQDFLRDMQDAGQTMEGYRAAPDKAAAFDMLANNLVYRKNEKELAKLLAEHGKGQDAIELYYSGELHYLQGKPAQAEKDFAAALAKNVMRDQWKYRQALNRARVKSGKAGDAYRILGLGDSRNFEDIAYTCFDQKDARQLEEVVALHRQASPDDPLLRVWDIDVLWLKKDYAGALKLLEERRQELMSRYRWKYENHRVRCLAKLKRTKEAIREAESIVQSGGNRVLLVYAHAAGGTAKSTIAGVEKIMPQRFLLEDCYRDPELGAILRSEAFSEFRRRFPPPREDQPFLDPIDE